MIRCGMAARIHSRSSERGSVLVSVLAIIFVLLTIFAAVLTYAIARYGNHMQNHNRLIARHLSNAGIQRSLHRLNTSGVDISSDTVVTPNGGTISTTLRPWGSYLLVISDGRMANQTVRSTAFIGSIPPDLFDAAITVCDERLPFVVAGRTKVVGDINTGTQGVTTGRVKGEGPTGDDFHDGENHVHAVLDVVAVDSNIIDTYFSNLAARISNADIFLQGSYVFGPAEDSPLSDSRTISVENNVRFQDLVFTTDGEIVTIDVGGFAEFRGKNGLSGLVEIACDGPIYVSDSAVLDQVLLYSRDSIVFRGDSRFAGVAISETKIVVEGNAALEYPSCLIVNTPMNGADEDGSIVLRSRNRHESVCYLASAESRDAERMLYLDTGIVLTGYLISHDKTDLRGAVLGSVMTEQFRFVTGPSTYINWIKDGYINRQGLDYDLLLPMMSNIEDSRFGLVRQDTFE